MQAVDPFVTEGAEVVRFGEGQPEYTPLPALVYPDGHILIEWAPTDEERERIARGENIRHWILKPNTVPCSYCGIANPCHFHPVRLEVTSEHIA